MKSLDGPAAAEIRKLLKGQSGSRFWRNLDELQDTGTFRRFLAEEFPNLVHEGPSLGRRQLLKLIGASLALAGLSACKGEEDEAALPYVNAPDGVTIGVAKWYATAVPFAGYVQPVLGKTFTGRPVKLERNPDHPMSRGATDAFTQMALLDLYDPGRSQMPLHKGLPSDWPTVERTMSSLAVAFDKTGGEGLRLLIGPTSSPTLARQIDEMTRRWPKSRWHLCAPVAEQLRLDATRKTFGRPLEVVPTFDDAAVIASFGDDFLGAGPRQTVNAARFADRRRLRQSRQGECQLFVAEPFLSLTGSAADRRLATNPALIGRLLQAVAHRLGMTDIPDITVDSASQGWCDAVATQLEKAGSEGVVTVGASYPVEIQQLGLAINAHIGSLQRIMRFCEPILLAPPDGPSSLRVLVSDMQHGVVSTLLVLDANPVYTSPGDVDFVEAMSKVTTTIHAGLHVDETAAAGQWHLPLQHALESWSDGRAVDGSISLIQPLVRPFYDVRSPHTVLEMLQGGSRSDRMLVEHTWKDAWGGAFEQRRRDSLNRGFIDGSAAPFLSTNPVNAGSILPDAKADVAGLTLLLKPDSGVWDGSIADNAWAQELPRPFSKIAWGNVLEISNQLAGTHKLKNGDEVRITIGGESVLAPVFIAPGQEAGTIVATFGYGRRHQGSIAAGLGFDAYQLRTSDQLWHRVGVQIEPTERQLPIASTQLHQAIDGFDFIRTVKLAAVDPHAAARQEKVKPPSLYPDRPVSDPSWGMSIDLDLCIGCNACVSACQAENNIPVVGKDLVAEGREMQWLRIDHYYEGPIEAPSSYFQPVPCMHCEQAPCEMGCPVNAAVHSIDGLNLQVYNRCIGTRTCSSYCPYKVRRFNWFDFTQNDPDQLKAMRNPDVSVRSRGVMEKCTYCVQRIAQARITADKEGRPIRDGEIVTACQQACPTRAIVFGNVADPSSEVSRRKAGERDYALLEEANTRPRTTYLARIDDEESFGGHAS